MVIQGKQIIDKKNQLRILLYQKEDKELQREQNRILVWNTKLTVWAVIFGLLAFLAQVAQVFVDITLFKK